MGMVFPIIQAEKNLIDGVRGNHTSETDVVEDDVNAQDASIIVGTTHSVRPLRLLLAAPQDCGLGVLVEPTAESYRQCLALSLT